MRKPEPVEIILIAVPLLCEAIAVILFISMIAVWALVLS
jgi:hypothetical protein